MAKEYNIKGMVDKIKALRKNAEELKEISGGIPAVDQKRRPHSGQRQDAGNRHYGRGGDYRKIA